MQQLSEEWFEARRGIPTASNFGNIITPTGKPSAGAGKYQDKLLAEWLTGERETFTSHWMERGVELEPQARAWFEFETGLDVEETGLITALDGMVGCSPDGLVGDDAGLEIKCPAPHTHVSYLLKEECPSIYVPQIQGSLYVTGRDSWHFLSFHPQTKPLYIHVQRDEKWIKAFDEIIKKFIDELLEKREKLTQYQIGDIAA